MHHLLQPGGLRTGNQAGSFFCSVLVAQSLLSNHSLLAQHRQFFPTEPQHPAVNLLVVLAEAWRAASNAPGGLGHAERRAWLSHTASFRVVDFDKKLPCPIV